MRSRWTWRSAVRRMRSFIWSRWRGACGIDARPRRLRSRSRGASGAREYPAFRRISDGGFLLRRRARALMAEMEDLLHLDCTDGQRADAGRESRGARDY